jgi:metal-responsive CopG/Arc/MetJ family transcriptional regulator
MKVKASISLSEDLIKAIDKLAGPHNNRSEFVERALWTYISQMARKEQNAKDLAIINRHAHRLNQEASDVLAYQVD